MANGPGVQISYAKIAQTVLIALSIGIATMLYNQKIDLTTLQVQVKFVQETVDDVSFKFDRHLETHVVGGSQ